jgi:hypothetical protein
MPDAEPRNGAEACQVVRRPQLSWWYASLHLTVGLAVCGFVYWLALISICGDATDIFIARVVVPVGSPLVFFVVLNELCNDANVVFDHEGISKPTWLGKYGVKTVRWQDILHVQTVVYRGSSSNTEIRLYAPGTRIKLQPNAYTGTFREDLARHLEHIPPSDRSLVMGGRR